MGDVSYLMPAIHPMVGGATGTGHGSDYLVQDYQLAVITAAKAMAMTVIDLLADDAAKGREVLAKYKPHMTKQEYLNLMQGMLKEDLYQS